jgi:hypothetical protein
MAEMSLWDEVDRTAMEAVYQRTIELSKDGEEVSWTRLIDEAEEVCGVRLTRHELIL